MKLTRHNGRSGKNGTYNPRHNDRRFNVENSEHIDAERAKKNIYWDCYRGFTLFEDREIDEEHDFSFEEVERIYYNEHYRDYIEAQNARNAITRHVERNRTVEDLLKNKKTCPEETIYQIGNVDETVPPEELLIVANIFFGELNKKYGEICPQQEKALEKMGIPLPDPDKPKSRTNNRKKTFDGLCRELLLDICDNRELYLDKEPEYGGRDYLEKQDYILMKQKEKLIEQKEQIIQQEQTLEGLNLKIEDVEMLIDEVSDVAYDKAVEVVTDKVRQETQKEDLALIEDYKKWVTSSERNIPKDKRDLIGKCLDVVQNQLRKAAKIVLNSVKTTMMNPKVKAESKEEIKTKAKSSVLAKLNQHRKAIAERSSDADRTRIQKNKEMER